MKQLDISVNPEDGKKSVLKILEFAKPHWKQDNINIERTTEGFINIIFKCSVSDVDKEGPVLVRVFGESEALHRDSETDILKLLHEKGLVSRLYCRFVNGIAYDFLPGSTITRKQLNDDNICNKLAGVLHSVHQLDVDKHIDINLRQDVMEQIQKRWEKISGEDFKEILDDDRYKQNLPSLDEYKVIHDRMKDIYTKLCESYPVVFCHVDAHVFNTIYDKDTDKLSLIDWELCCYAPEIYDAAVVVDRDPTFTNDFNEPESRKQWLRCYLSTHPVHGTKPLSDEMLNQWYTDSLKASLVSMFFVLLFGVECMKYSPKEGDYISLSVWFLNRFRQCDAELQSINNNTK